MGIFNSMQEAKNKEVLKFSFSVPVLNSEKYLERCLKSIREQEYPQDQVEIFVVDAGSQDRTLDIARKYTDKIYPNPLIIGEYGMKVAVGHATGDLLVMFAADNELPRKDWLKELNFFFRAMPHVSAFWGGAKASFDDPPMNHYYELIQSEPLAYFLNQNLKGYLKQSSGRACFNGNEYSIFKVDPEKPLCWGANGLVYRLSQVRDIFLQEGYIGDNEVFQEMVRKGFSTVAYSAQIPTYHHTVSSLKHWISKWKRNYSKIFLPTRKERQIDWFYAGNFRLKMLLWLLYSLNPLLTVPHSLYLAWAQKNKLWLYHPIACFCQTVVYLYYSFVLREGRKVMIESLLGQNYRSLTAIKEGVSDC